MGGAKLQGNLLDFALKHAECALESRAKGITLNQYVRGKEDFFGKPMSKHQLSGWVRKFKEEQKKKQKFEEIKITGYEKRQLEKDFFDVSEKIDSKNDNAKQTVFNKPEERGKSSGVNISLQNGMSIQVDPNFDQETLVSLIKCLGGSLS